jgi:citrate synthase
MTTLNKSRVQGLDDVIACETQLSHVDGEKGLLWLRGLSLEQATQLNWLDLVSLLWQDFYTPLPMLLQWGEARQNAYQALEPLWPVIQKLKPLEAVRAGLALLPGNSQAFELISAAQVIFAGWLRLQKSASPLAPESDLDPVLDFGRMLSGTIPDDAWVKALNIYWISVSDHGLNASTFTARVIASTRSDLCSALLGAMGALKGPLHGGAPGPVLDMLDAIGSEDQAQLWIHSELSSGKRLMGFGHRIYRVRDPRADVLKQALQDWQSNHDNPRLALAREVERVALAALNQHKPERKLDTNVEFYTALLLEALGFERDSFTTLFALGRMIGWSAHVAEQINYGRLIRPQSRYIGPALQAVPAGQML